MTTTTMEFLENLRTEAFAPLAERIARIHDQGDIAVVVYKPAPQRSMRQVLAGLGGGKGLETRAFPLSRARAKRVLANTDIATLRWIARHDPSVVRIFVVSGLGTLLVNLRPGQGFEIEPGSLDRHTVN